MKKRRNYFKFEKQFAWLYQPNKDTMDLSFINTFTEQTITPESLLVTAISISALTLVGLTITSKNVPSPPRHKIISFDITDEISSQSAMIPEGRDGWETIHRTRQHGFDTSKWEGSKGKSNLRTSPEQAKKIIEDNTNVEGFTYNENTGMAYFHHTISRDRFKGATSKTNFTLYIKP